MSGWFLAMRALANIISIVCVVWYIVRACQRKHTRTRYVVAYSCWALFWFGIQLWANGWHF